MKRLRTAGVARRPGDGAARPRRGLVVELGLWMLVIALLPVALTVALSNRTFETALGTEVRGRLERIASESTRRIETYVNGLIVDVGLVADNALTVQALNGLSERLRREGVDGADYRRLTERFDAHFAALRGRKQWADLLLIDQRGQVVYSARRGEELGAFLHSPMLAGTELARSVSAANTLLQSEVSNFDDYPPARAPAGFLAAPIFEDGVIIGNVVIRIDPEALRAILGEVGGLGESGEVLAGAMHDGALRLVSPLRHPRATADGAAALDRVYWPLAEALQGREGAGAYVDDRQTDTEAVWRFVPSLNWAMVAKIDGAEVHAASHSFRRMSLVVVLLSLGFVGLGTYLAHRAISRPIVRLAGLVGSLTGDHLPPSLPVRARNEIGILIASFNRLISRLREHQGQLERTVDERTAALTASEAELRRYIRVVDDNVATLAFDPQRRVQGASNAFCRLSGRSRDELLGLPLRALLHPDVSDARIDQLWASVAAGRTWQGELTHRREAGDPFQTEEVITPEFADGVLTRVTTVLRDVTDRKRIEVLSITDELTGLYNRRHLNAVFADECARARRDGRGLGLLLWDVDYFKRFNDHYGHQAGDVVLQQLARAARQTFQRAGDLAFRLGGEEFGVLLAVDGIEPLQQAGERLVAAVAALRIAHDGNEVAPFVTISCGAALGPWRDAPDLDALYLRADQALYQAKQSGRHRMVCARVPTSRVDRASPEASSHPG